MLREEAAGCGALQVVGEREGEVSVPSFEILPSVVSCGSRMLLHTCWRCSFAAP